MGPIEEVWASVQPVLGSYPVLVLIGAVLVFGIVKKLVKLAVTAGLLVVVWLVIQQMGVQLPV